MNNDKPKKEYDECDKKIKVIVRQGTKNLGGCCTEIIFKNTRIAVDFGSPLPEEDSVKLEVEGLTYGKSSFDAVLFTHYHGDHVGEMGRINSDIQIYMSGFAKDIIEAYKKHNRHSFEDFDTSRINEIIPGKELEIGDLKILPILSDHSAAESLMFLIKADCFQILHTGDFRLHGRYKEELLNSLSKIGKIDLLITEGTTLSREEETDNYTEEVVEEKIKECINKNDYCFFILSSTNFDRFKGIINSVKDFRQKNKPKGKYFLVDEFQKSLFEIAERRLADRYRFNSILTYGKNLTQNMEKIGFAMLIRPSNPEHREILQKYLGQDYCDKTCLIYSMWSGYMGKGEIKTLTDAAYEKNRLRIIHSSGHVTKQDLLSFIKKINPGKVIIIHTNTDKELIDISNQIPVEDGEMLCFELNAR